MDDLKLHTPADDPVEIAARTAVIPCVESLGLGWGDARVPSCLGKETESRRDFGDRPGSPHEVVVRDRGPRVHGLEHRFSAGAEIAAVKQRGREGVTASSPTSGLGPAFPGDRLSESN